MALGEQGIATRIGVSVPTFEEYVTRFANAEVIEFSSGDKDFMPDLSLLKSVAAETDALVLVNPDNPSGQCCPNRSARTCRSYGARGKAPCFGRVVRRLRRAGSLHIASLARRPRHSPTLDYFKKYQQELWRSRYSPWSVGYAGCRIARKSEIPVASLECEFVR